MYEIQFVPLETFKGQISTNNIIVYTSNGSLLLIVLTGLEEYVEYNISVRAYSNAGPGPYSIGSIERTDTAVSVCSITHLKIFFQHTAPDNSPRNVTATAVSSTEIEVLWKEIAACH